MTMQDPVHTYPMGDLEDRDDLDHDYRIPSGAMVVWSRSRTMQDCACCREGRCSQQVILYLGSTREHVVHGIAWQ